MEYVLSGRFEPPTRRIARAGATAWVTSAIVSLVALAPALDVLLGHRNLMIENYLPTLASGLPVMHYATAASVFGGLAVIALCLITDRTHLTRFAIAGALFVFYVTNVVLPAGFGAVPHVSRSLVYALVIFVAFYLSRDDGSDVVVDAARNSLLVLMVASLVCLFVTPELTRRVYAPEVRLPFIDFRFWGLGASPNNIAPLALQLALFTLHRPFRRTWCNSISLASALAVMLLAQSQTTWAISLVVVPLFLLYRNGMLGADKVRLSPGLAAVALPFAIFAVFALLGLAWSEWTSPVVSATDAITFTGRTDVWRVAWDEFERNPIFGYGHLAWQEDFRHMIRMTWAFHAHNQMLQSLSVAGMLGGIGLLIYIGVLVRYSVASAAATRGLAPALLAIILVRSITETPLDMSAALLGESIVHLVLFRLLTSPDRF